MMQLWLEAQLNVDTSRGPLGDAAYVWFDTLTRALTPAERAELAGLPAATRINPLAEGPQGEPGKLYGLIEVDRSIGGGYPTTERRHLSDEGWEWLRGELADLPKNVTVWIGRFTGNGFLGGRLMVAKAWPVRNTPGWLVLDAQVVADQFTDPGSGRAEQQRWLGAIRQAADRLNPSFGQIDYWRDKGTTALERWSTGLARDAQLAIPQTRERLRGYSWLTIASQEVAEKLGGAAAVAATGAFAEVEPLTEGGLWLLATEDFADYGMKAAESVFHAVAPALPPGMPRQRDNYGEPPTFVVIADPSDR
ncbi:hypothetical protein ACQP2Y_15735 [Actinoplanes sp. CA-051413]|uniref:hypothetical protein n=1 Tax=Actinoplanes sp. CA-051413 TaxID=3239899 RepID=UPI003D990AF6